MRGKVKTGCLILIMTAYLLFIVTNIVIHCMKMEHMTDNFGEESTVFSMAAQRENLQKENLQKGNLQEENTFNVKKVALTFDDGPHPVYTGQLLDGLKKRNVKVTFFVTGSNAALHEDIITKMHEDGHLIGNHTYNHIALNKNNRQVFRNELVQTNACIERITGEEVLYVRPPYGVWDKDLEKELNMIPVLWNVDPLDWCTDRPYVVVRNVIDKVKDGDIILMHDYYASSVTAALEIVDELTERGYEFVTVDELILD